MSNIGVPAALPTGGTTGQILTKASNGDYDTAWTTGIAAGGPQPGPLYVSGRWYDNRLFPDVPSARFQIAAQCYYVPFYLPQPVAITALGVNLTQAPPAGIVGYLGVSAAGATGLPAAQVVTAQTINPTVVGPATATLASTVTLPAGWLWGAIGFTAQATVSSAAAGAIRTPIGTSGGPNNAYPPTAHIDTSGPVPQPNPTVTGQTSLNTTSIIWYRAA